MDNFFTSPSPLRVLKESVIAATGTVRPNAFASSWWYEETGKRNSDVVNDKKSNVTFVCWKDNKVVIVASTLYGKESIKRARRYIKDQGGRVEIDQPNAISFYSKTMGGVNRMDQNIGPYMIKYMPFSFVAYNL